MIGAIQKLLRDMGYQISTQAYDVIQTCDDWYRARHTKAHERITVNGEHYRLERMGFGRRAASDDANLCEVLEINAGEDNQAQFEFVNDVLRHNRFDTQYRRQLELVAAEGTAAAYIWVENAQLYTDGSVRGGDLRINYVDALGFVPLTVENNEVTEAAFVGQRFTGTKTEHTAVICRRENGIYSYTIRVFDDRGELLPEKNQDVRLGNVKPFAVLRTAQVNTFDGMEGFGFPKLYGVIPILKGLDAAFTAFLGDLDSSEKITLINEMICGFDDQGRPITPNAQMKRRFVMLGEKLPQDKEMVHEINPEIRSEAFREAIELMLNLMSQQFGYGTRKYSLDPSGGVVTATEYIGERQDMLQELGRQRHEAKEYITGVVRAILWFSNAYWMTAWNVNADVLVEFDDSMVLDKRTILEDMRADVIAGIGGAYVRALYLKQKYNLDDAEAERWARMEDPDAGAEPED